MVVVRRYSKNKIVSDFRNKTIIIINKSLHLFAFSKITISRHDGEANVSDSDSVCPCPTRMSTLLTIKGYSIGDVQIHVHLSYVICP